MRRVLADTGPLYAAYDSSDHYHKQAHRELNTLKQKHAAVVLPSLVLAEYRSLLLKRFNPSVGFRFLQEMTAGTFPLGPIPEDYQFAIQLLHRYPDQTITLCDATLASVLHRLRLSVWTYDFHFDVMRSLV